MGLVAILTAQLPGAEVLSTQPPEVPTALYDRQDLALIFGKHRDTTHRWEQDGWIKAIRKPSGRIIGYPADQVVGIAARLFTRFPNASFNEIEARRLGLYEVLQWTLATVHCCQRSSPKSAPPPLDVMNLAALAGTTRVIPDGWEVTEANLAEQHGEAVAQLLRRLMNPQAKQAMLRAWREAGLMEATNRTVFAAAAATNSHREIKI